MVWKSKVLSDKTIKTLTITRNRLALRLDYLDNPTF